MTAYKFKIGTRVMVPHRPKALIVSAYFTGGPSHPTYLLRDEDGGHYGAVHESDLSCFEPPPAAPPAAPSVFAFSPTLWNVAVYPDQTDVVRNRTLIGPFWRREEAETCATRIAAGFSSHMKVVPSIRVERA